MSRMKTLIILIITAIIGVPLAILGTDMLLSDLVNKGAQLLIFSSLTSALLGAVVVTVFIGVIRLYLRPNTRKKATKNYTIIVLVLSSVGFISSILSGIIEYQSLVKPYPFPGFLIIFMIAHLLVIASCVYGLVFCIKKMPEDQEAFKVTVGHVFKTIGWFLFVSLTLNRFGMFVISPLYIEWRTFGMTFVFYLYLLVPLALGIYKVLKLLGFIGEGLGNTIFAISMEVINLALCAVIVILGSTHSEFISAVSPAMGLERISSMPFEIIIHFASYTGVVTMMLVQSLKRK